MSVAYGASGAIVYSTGNPAPAYPTGITAGQLLLLEVRTKPDNTPATTPTGFTLLGAFSGGQGTTGIDTGPTRVGIFYKIADGTETGTVTVTVTGNNVSSAQIHRYTKTLSAWDIGITGGADATVGTAYSVVTGTVAAAFVAVGDILHFVTTFPTDTNPTWGTATLTAQGGGTITLGTATVITTATTASGQDLGGRTVRFTPTASTQAAGTLTFASTLSGTTTNASGPTALIRIRDYTPVAPGVAAAPTVSITGQDEWTEVTTPAAFPSSTTTWDIQESVNGGAYSTIYTTAQVLLNYGFTSRNPTSAYTYRMLANGPGGSTAGTASAAVSPNPTSPAFSLTPGNAKITVSFTERAYAAKYKVYRGLSGGARSLVHTSTTQDGVGTYTWEDTGVANGIEYDYHVTTEAQTPTVRESTAGTPLSATPNVISYQIPIQDITQSNWAHNDTPTHWEALVEDPSLADSTRIEAGLSPGTMEVKLGPYSGGGTPTAANLKSWIDNFSFVTCFVSLVQGTTVIATANVAHGFAGTHTLTLTAPQLASITDWDDLRVRYGITQSNTDLLHVYSSRLNTTPGGSAEPIVASDTLSASVTESTATKVNLTASDTLSASVADSSATNVARAAADTLSATVTEGRSFGTVAVVAADTLSAAVTDTASVKSLLVAADNLNATVNDSSTYPGLIENLLANTNFEWDSNADGLADGWSVFGSPVTTIDTGVKYAGLSSQKVVSAGGTVDIHFNNIPAKASTMYGFSVFANVTALTGSVVFKVEWLDDTNAVVGYDYTVQGTTTSGFQRLFFTSTSAALTTKARVIVAIESGTGTVYLNHIQMNEGFVRDYIEPENDWFMRAIMTNTDAPGASGAIGVYVDRQGIRPYEASFAALGMAFAYQRYGIQRYADAAWNWLAWYSAHMETDKTMYDYDIVGGVLTKLSSRDSTDSYAAMFLLTTHLLNQIDPRPATLATLDLAGAVDAITLTQTADGLTWAKPEFQAKYLMDNAEVYAGLSAAVLMGVAKAGTPLARVKTGMDNLWNAATPVAPAYNWAKSDIGVETVTTWATLGDALQQAWSVIFGVSDSTRSANLMTQFLASHPNWHNQALTGRYDALVGEALDFVGSDSTETAGVDNIFKVSQKNNRAWDWNPKKAAWGLISRWKDGTALRLAVSNLPAAATDSVAASVAESTAVKVGITSSDTLSAAVTETSGFGSSAVVAADTLSARVTDTGTFATVAVTASDSLVPSVVDLSSSFIANPGADGLVAAVSESSQIVISGLITLASSDTLSAVVTESTAFAPVTVTASDTLSARVTDAFASQYVTLAASDTTSASVSESRSFGTVAVVASDTLSASVSEAVSALRASFTKADTLTSSANDSGQFSTVSVSAVDSAAVTLSETSQFATISLSASDSLNVSVSDASTAGPVSAMVQEAPEGTSDAGSTSVTSTFSTPATAGNIIWAAAAVNKAAGTFTAPAGTWNTLISHSSSSVSIWVGWKVATGGETGLTLSWTTPSPAGATFWTSEWTQSGTGEWEAKGSATNPTNESAVLSWASGTTGATTGVGRALAFFAIDAGTSGQGESYDNGFTSAHPYASTARGGISAATKGLTPEGGTDGTTQTHPTTSDQISAAVAVFGRGADAIPVAASDTLSLSVSELNSTGLTLASNDSLDAEIVDSGIVFVITNLASDTGFEIDTNADGLSDGFTTYNSPITTAGGSQRPGTSGSRSQRIQKTGSTNVDIRSYPVLATEGQAYTFSTYANLVATTGDTFVFKVEWLNSVGGVTGFDYSVVSAGGWGRTSFTSTAPAGTTQASIIFALEGVNTSTVDVDDYQMEAGSVLHEYVPGQSLTLVAAADTLSTNLSDSSVTSKTALVVSTESLSAAVTESVYFATIPIAASDSLTPVLSDAGVPRAAAPASDTLIVNVSETSQVVISGLIVKAATDTLTARLSSEVSSFGTVAVSGADTLSAAVTEGRSFGTVAVVAADSLTASVSESATFATVAVASPDTLSASVNDTGLFSTVQVGGLDDLVVTVSESRVLTSMAPGVDSLIAQVSETSDILVSGQIPKAASDTLTAGVTENIAFATVPVTASDTLSVNETETTQFATVAVVAADALNANVTETTQFATVAFTRTDTLTAAVTETTQFATVTVTGNDSLNASLVDSGAFAPIQVVAADTISANLTEGRQFATIPLASSDTASVGLNDSGVFATVAVTAADALTAVITDTGSLQSSAPGVDNVFATVTETTEILAVGSDTKFASDTLSASVDDSATNAPTLLASDALNVSLDDQGVFATVAVVASDSLNVSANDIGTFGNIAVTGSDTLTAAATETTSFATVAVTASDTLSAKYAGGAGGLPTLTVLASDNFNRGNQTGLGTSAEGWPWTVVSGSINIVSNVASGQNGGTSFPYSVRAEFDTGSPDMIVEGDLNSHTNSAAYSGLAARFSPSAETHYALMRDRQGGVYIHRVVNGARTVLATYGSSLGSASLYEKWSLEVKGTEIKAYRHGVLILSVTDSVITTGNYAGISYGSNGGANRATVDNWRVAQGTVAEGRVALYDDSFNRNTTAGYATTFAGSALGVPVATGYPAVSGGPFTDAWITVATAKLSYPANGTGRYHGLVFPNSLPADCFIESEVSAATESTRPNGGLGLRMSASGVDGYWLRFGSNGNFTIIKLVNSVASTLTSGTVAWPASAKNWRFEARGNTLRAVFNEVEVANITDNTYLNGGFYAVGAETNNQSMNFEDIIVGSLPAGAVGDGESASVSLVTLSSSDALQASVDESVNFATVTLAAADTLSVAMGDEQTFAPVEVVASDDLNASASESILLDNNFPGADFLNCVVTETAEVVVSGVIQIAASVNLVAEVTETVTLKATLTPVADALSVAVDESTAFATVAVTGTDALVPVVAEGNTVFNGMPGNDTLAVNLSESSEIVVGGNFTKESSDTLYARVDEASGFDTIVRVASDTLTAAVADSGVFSTVQIVASDTAGVSVNDQTVSLVNLPGFDTLSVNLIESALVEQVGDVTKSASDNLNVTIVESSGSAVLTDHLSGTGGSATSISILCDPDVVVGTWAMVTTQNRGSAFTSSPAGWSMIPGTRVWLHRIVAGEPGNTTWTWTWVGGRSTTWAIEYASPQSEEAPRSVFATANSSPAPSLPVLTNVKAGSVVVASITISSGTTNLSTPPNGWTLIDFVSTGISSTSSRTWHYSKAVTAVADIGGEVIPFTGNNNGSTSTLVAFEPVGASADNQITAIFPGEDTLSVQAVEGIAFDTVALSSSDSLSASLVESRQFGQVAVGANESLQVALSDTGTLGTIQIVKTDLLTVTLGDNVGRIAQLPGLDSLYASVMETSSIEISGLIIKTASDTLFAGVDDEALQGRTELAGADTLSARVTDVGAFSQGNIGTMDTLSARVTDTATLSISMEIVSDDTLTVGVVDGASLDADVESSDELAAKVTESNDIKKKNAREHDPKSWILDIDKYRPGPGMVREPRRNRSQ